MASPYGTVREVFGNKSPDEAVGEVFGNKPTAELDRFLSVLRTNWADLAHGMSRRTTYLFLSVAVFELLTRAQVSDVALGPIRLERFTFIELLIPVLFSYLIFEQAIATNDYSDFAYIANAIVRVQHPKLEKFGWQTLLEPSLPILWSTRLSEQHSDTGAGMIRGLFSLGVTLLVWLASALFPFYAIFRLFQVLPAEDNVWVWISLVLTALFTCVAVIFFTMAFRAAPFREGPPTEISATEYQPDEVEE